MPPDVMHDPIQVEPTTSVAAFFDVDNTLLPGLASELRFFRYLWRLRVVGWREAMASLGYLLRRMPPVSYQPLRLQKLYLIGKSPALIEELAERFCQEQLIPALSREAVGRLRAHQKAGHEVVLITGSLDCLIQPLARHLGVETVLAAQPARTAGAYVGPVLAPLPYGEGKGQLINRLALARGFDLSSSYAYGDSPGDVALLELVGHPLVVNPIRGMAQVAKSRQWPVVHWG